MTVSEHGFRANMTVSRTLDGVLGDVVLLAIPHDPTHPHEVFSCAISGATRAFGEAGLP
jgi:hypothetical protein